MDPIIARLDRLERDYRRSRTWNRVALLALLVAVCAGFAQQQDLKLPDVIKCKTLEAETVRATSIEFRERIASIPESPAHKRARFSVTLDENAAVLQLGSPMANGHFSVLTGDLAAAFSLGRFQRVVDPAKPVRQDMCTSISGNVWFENDPQLHIRVDGHQRAVLGFMRGTDHLGRGTDYPASTLTLLDKDGKFLERLPR